MLQLPGRPETKTVRLDLVGGGLVLKAPRLVYHSTLGSRVKKKKREPWNV